MPKIGFHEIEALERRPGIYEIYTNSGIPLKVGISKDIRKRLLQHRASRQNALRLRPGGDRRNPNNVESKQSVLAKHLYYDESLTQDFDLKLEQGRREFLISKCHILFEYALNKEEVRRIELHKEHQVNWRYIGGVVRR